MKKIVSLSLVICALLLMASCSDEDNYQTVVPKFVITKSDNIDMSAKGGTAIIEFVSEGAEVKASIDADWCRVKEITNNKVSVSVDINKGYPSRSALVVLTDGETTQQVSILQTGALWIFDRNETTIYVKDTSGDVFIEMSSTFPIELPQDISEWITGEVTDSGFKLSFDENPTSERRSSTFTVKMNDKEVEYTVIQYGVKDLLGAWGGTMQMDSPGLGINNEIIPFSDAIISATASEGQYLIHIPLDNLGEGLGLDLVASYKSGRFIVTVPQQQDIILSGALYGSVIAKTFSGDLYLNADITLIPTFNNRSVTLAYESEIYFIVGFFMGRVPSANNFYSEVSIDLPALSMKKSLSK